MRKVNPRMVLLFLHWISISETLWPFELRDERIIDVQLTPRARRSERKR